MPGPGTHARILLLAALALTGCPAPQPTPAPNGEVAGREERKPVVPSKTPSEWLAQLRDHPAVGCSELRERPKLFPLSRRAPRCGALHPLPPYRAALVRDLAARPAPKLVAFARRFLSLAPFEAPWPLPKGAQAALDLQTHLCVDVLGAAGDAGARASLLRLGREPAEEEEDEEDEDSDDAESDPGQCLAWQRQRARLAGDLLAGRVPASLSRARRTVVRFLREHVGKDGRIGAAWVHPQRWPCRARAEEDGAPAELVTALGCLALMGERDAPKLLARSVRWLCAALPRTRSKAHPQEGCLDDLCRCEELGPREEALILRALTAAKARGVERGRATAAMRRNGPPRKVPRRSGGKSYPSTDAPLDLWRTAVGLSGKQATAAWERRLWTWRFAQRLERSFEGRNDDLEQACAGALGEEAPAQEAALWLLSFEALAPLIGRATAKGAAPPAPAAPRIRLRGSGRGWLALRAELSLGLLLRGYRPVEGPASHTLRVTQRETDSEWRVILEQPKSKPRSAVCTNAALPALARQMLLGLGLQRD